MVKKCSECGGTILSDMKVICGLCRTLDLPIGFGQDALDRAEMLLENSKLCRQIKELEEECEKYRCMTIELEGHLAMQRKRATQLQELLRKVMYVVDSDHIKTAESIARIHGYELDKETALQYWAILKEAHSICNVSNKEKDND